MRILTISTMAGIAALAVAVNTGAASESEKRQVLKTYVDIAHAKYEDSLHTAKDLMAAVNRLVQSPTEAKLRQARKAWLASRKPYQQSEVYRFGNAVVDDWEGKVNAWPLDEGLIDYVDASYGKGSDENPFYSANLIANTKLRFGGREIDASRITKALLAETLHEIDEIEANVATGYHAVEFMLWGQDLNGTGPGAGARPATDFDPKNCTGGNCGRRGEFLKVVTELLIDDLGWITEQWAGGGEARQQLLAGKADQGLIAILTGMGSLSYGELAGERMKLGLMLHDPEEEHDCFSDNTHNSHYYNVVGMRNVVLGEYTRIDGSKVAGPGLASLLEAGPRKELLVALNETEARAKAMVKRAESGEAYDQMIGEGNAKGNKVIQDVIDALLVQTKAIQRAAAALDLEPIEFEGSDSLDSPEKVL